VIFFNKAHELITSRETKDDSQLFMEHGKPLVFGKEKNKGIVLRGTSLEVVTIGEQGITADDLLVHNQYDPDPGIHMMLARMMPPEFPVALGIIRSVAAETFETTMMESIQHEKEHSKIKTVDDMLNSGNTWTIE